MNIQIDNYYISTDANGYMNICIDGQNIIHDKPNCVSRGEAMVYALKAIEKYNERHNLAWGKLK